VPIPKIRLESAQSKDTAYIADDVLGQLFVEKRSRKQSLRSLDLLMTLKPGDYVVHQEHGIGKFLEMTEKEVMGINREYVAIGYAKDDKLYVPITELYRVTKYLGEEHPKLHDLGGTVWKKTLKDTEAEVLKTASELLDIYARRKITPGYAFGKFPEKETAFRLAFPHIHTADQISAIEDIFEDMESPEPMDRLLCGDVGFGKTEVAMNAAYKAVLSGKQAAIISPLVVLTLEHFDSFVKRFAGTGIGIAVLSRLSGTKEADAALEGIRNGTVKIIVGTHRLLGADVRFQKLGLLVIDEEHRFGVLDKEKIKRLRAGIDILSLSATPIPRSLNLSLSGLKKLSILTTPPPNKKPIGTQVIKWDETIIRETIVRELDRGGQVIFLHNRVASLAGTAKEIERIAGRKLHPLLLHGQMKAEEIENVLLDFRSGESNCLVSTTVIENGVNFLNANTIVIDHADEFGLAQLHQLRGRVGRKDRDAHCLLVYRKEVLPDDSKKRLISLVEYSHLGAGFEIAMRDLEIRGAGEILGIAQSGRSRETGVSLYLKLLENKMQELQTGTVPHTTDVKIELDVQFVLPDTLFNGDIDKIQFYRSLEGIDSVEDLESTRISITGTHGENEDVERLFLLLKARILLSEYGIFHLKKVLRDYVFDFRGATTRDIRNFLAIDREGNFLVQNLDRVRVGQNIYAGDLDFLSKLVYSLTAAKQP
jgi:transcription-repair coupling factor (superfamily II helicase)